MFKKIWLSLIAVLLFSYCATAGESVFSKYDILDCRTGELISAEQLESEVLKNDIIYSLESHNNIAHHIIQKELAELVDSMNIGKTVLAHEFFIKNCYGHQELLDKLSGGEITLNEFLDSVKYTMDRTRELTLVFEIIAKLNLKSLALSVPMPLPGEIIPELKQLTVLPTMDRRADLNSEFIKYAVEDGLADYIFAPKKECEKNEISLPLPDGNFYLIREGSFGKTDLAHSLMNGGILEEEALMATEGWVGDKFIFFVDADMLKFFSIIKIVWNTEKDAEEFFNVYAKMSNNTMGECRILSGKFFWEIKGFKRTVERSGIRVEINAEMIVE